MKSTSRRGHATQYAEWHRSGSHTRSAYHRHDQAKSPHPDKSRVACQRLNGTLFFGFRYAEVHAQSSVDIGLTISFESALRCDEDRSLALAGPPPSSSWSTHANYIHPGEHICIHQLKEILEPSRELVCLVTLHHSYTDMHNTSTRPSTPDILACTRASHTDTCDHQGVGRSPTCHFPTE